MLPSISITLVFLSLGVAAQNSCYYAAGKPADSHIVPCDSSSSISACCQAGDLCLSNSACWDPSTGVTYLYGCSDPNYSDASCPYKCGSDYASAPYVGIEFCSNTTHDQWACTHPPNDGSTVQVNSPQECVEDSSIAFAGGASLQALLSLPANAAGSTSYYSGYTPITTSIEVTSSVPTTVQAVSPSPTIASTTSSASNSESSPTSATPTPLSTTSLVPISSSTSTEQPTSSTTTTGQPTTSSSASFTQSPTILQTSPTSSSPSPSSTTSSSASSTSSAPAVTSPTSSAKSSGLSTGAKAGIGAGVGVAALAAIALLALLLFRRRRSHEPVSQSEDRYEPPTHETVSPSRYRYEPPMAETKYQYVPPVTELEGSRPKPYESYRSGLEDSSTMSTWANSAPTYTTDESVYSPRSARGGLHELG